MASRVGSGGSWDWRTAEASLYCIRAIAKAVPTSEDTLMPQVIDTCMSHQIGLKCFILFSRML